MENSTRIHFNPYEVYLNRFAENYNMTVEEASKTAIVKAVLEHYIETGVI